MALSRRTFLRTSLGIGLLVSSGYILKNLFLPAAINSAERITLESFLDALIPADETPSATQLGVAGKILTQALEDSQYRRLIKKGCGWLDHKARQHGADGFHSLGNREKEKVVAEAADADADSLPGIFFARLRSDAFFHYYAHPSSWKGLGYKGPPQPDGYPDYALAPEERS
jgi:hypothetical protein